MPKDVIGAWEIESVGNYGRDLGMKAGFYVFRKVSGPSFCPNARQYMEKRGTIARFGSQALAESAIARASK